MKRIIFRMKIFSISSVVFLISALLLTYSFGIGDLARRHITIAALALNLILAGILLLMFCRQYVNYKRALLIIENKLLYIPVVSAADEGENIKIYFSSFGILLEDKVIPFKADDKKLISLNLNNHILEITYEKKSKRKNIEIYTYLEEDDELRQLQNRLYFETGVNLNISPPLGDTFFGE